MELDLEPASPHASPPASPVQLNRSLSSSIDSTDSQDTVIIEESSSCKRMRLDHEAKKVSIKKKTLKKKFKLMLCS